jgi:transcriptional regulator with AAA-type ATPase domain/tetratricopeptide (TPR) repeat protein
VNTLDELIGESAAMAAVRTSVQRLLGRRSEARRMPPVLLLGETGTGKGLLANLLHRGSVRRAAAFVDQNCASIPETMLESELFGHERGAFTDARESKPGLFHAARGGTLFLDEIGLLSPTLQGKVLKAVEEQTIRRLGSTRAEPVDVWIIAATSDDLVSKVRDGRFREDLYHRLAVVSFALPPLRERGADIVVLAERFLDDACRDYGLPRKRLTPDAHAALLAYSWPGNVRELANLMERVVLLFDGPVVSSEALMLPVEARRRPPAAVDRIDEVDSATDHQERELLAALQATDWNITRTAQRLMLSRNTVKARMQRYGLRPDAVPSARRTVEPVGNVAPPVLTSASRPLSGALLWESRRLTVLRAEVAKTDGSARSGADEAFGAVVEKVTTFGGRVEDVSPRAVTAVFGLDRIDDAARRAANAALAIARTLREHQRGPRVTLALHVGELLVARLPGGTAIDVQSKHDVSTVLERLTGHGTANSVIVSDAAGRFLSRRFELVPVDDGGHHDTVFRLAGPERSGFVPFADGGSFVGRNYDLEVAHRRFALATSGYGQVLSIVGEPGIGKSRLVYEFGRMIADRGCRVLMTSCPSHGAAFPFLPVISIVRSLFDLGDVDDARAVRETVTQAVDKFGSALAADNLPATLALLDALPTADPLRLLTPAQRRQQVQEAVCQLILNESSRQPLVVIVDDAHWIDSDSQSVLDALVDRLAAAPVMLVITHRPEHRCGWSHKQYFQQVSLEPLTPAHVTSVLDELLGHDEMLHPLKDAIVRRTEGNPFFVEETVRGLVESGCLAGHPGGYMLATRVDAIQVPPTVQAVLGERIDRLDMEDKRLLQAAAIVGHGGAGSLLAEVVELPPASFRRALAQLHRANLLYEGGDAEDPTIAFRHALVQEVAAASLPADRRRALHARCLAALETGPGSAADDCVEQAAHHAFHGELWESARTYAPRAAAKAVARSAYRTAVRALEQGLVAMDKLPPGRETLAAAIDVRFDLRNMLWALGELSSGLGVLQEALPLAEALGDKRRLARVFAHTSSNYWVLGDNERALALVEQAVALANQLGDVPLRVDCNQLFGMLHNSLGDYRAAATFFERIITEVAAADRPGRFTSYYAVHARTWLAWVLSQCGEFDRAATLAEEALALAEASNDLHNLVTANWGAGVVALGRGSIDRALTRLRHAYEAAQSAEMTLWARPTAAMLGRASMLAGQVTEGRRLLEAAMKDGENNVAVAAWETYLAESCLLAGDVDAADTTIAHALALAEKRHEQGFLAHAHRVAAEIARRRGRIDVAREHYEDALVLAGEREMRPLLMQCELGLAELSRSLRDDFGAAKHAAAADALCAEMEIPTRTDPAPRD